MEAVRSTIWMYSAALAADIVGLNYGFHMSLEFGKVGRLSQGVLTNSGPR
jgi:hypothetical protein